MDAVAIQTSIEVSSDCTDRERAAADLAAALASARAPRRGGGGAWRLDMRVTSAPGGVRVATARMVDDHGRFVADRTISDRTSGECVALAHAVGAWASVVLDDALGSDAVEHASAPDPVPAPAPVPAPVPEMAGPRTSESADAVKPSESTPKTYEVGTMLILRNGVAANGGIFGASPFMTVAFSEIWVIRPSVLVGTSTSPLTPGGNVTYLGGRVDFCRRVPGNYLDRRGIEVDVCAGADGARAGSRLNDVARASVGPSAVIRGELGANLGLETRMVAGANLLRGGLGDDAPFFVVAGEVGASVRFR